MEIVRLIALLVSVVISFIYISTIFSKHGVPKSISMSYYSLPKKERFCFQLFVWSLSLLLVVAGWDMLFSIGAALLFVVGLTPTTQDEDKKWIRVVHFICAASSIIIMTVGCTISFNDYFILFSIPINLFMMLISVKKPIGNKLFENILTWVEITFILNIIVSVFTDIISKLC